MILYLLPAVEARRPSLPDYLLEVAVVGVAEHLREGFPLISIRTPEGVIERND